MDPDPQQCFFSGMRANMFARWKPTQIPSDSQGTFSYLKKRENGICVLIALSLDIKKNSLGER